MGLFFKTKLTSSRAATAMTVLWNRARTVVPLLQRQRRNNRNGTTSAQRPFSHGTTRPFSTSPVGIVRIITITGKSIVDGSIRTYHALSNTATTIAATTATTNGRRAKKRVVDDTYRVLRACAKTDQDTLYINKSIALCDVVITQSDPLAIALPGLIALTLRNQHRHTIRVTTTASITSTATTTTTTITTTTTPTQKPKLTITSLSSSAPALCQPSTNHCLYHKTAYPLWPMGSKLDDLIKSLLIQPRRPSRKNLHTIAAMVFCTTFPNLAPIINDNDNRRSLVDKYTIKSHNRPGHVRNSRTKTQRIRNNNNHHHSNNDNNNNRIILPVLQSTPPTLLSPEDSTILTIPKPQSTKLQSILSSSSSSLPSATTPTTSSSTSSSTTTTTTTTNRHSRLNHRSTVAAPFKPIHIASPTITIRPHPNGGVLYHGELKLVGKRSRSGVPPPVIIHKIGVVGPTIVPRLGNYIMSSANAFFTTKPKPKLTQLNSVFLADVDAAELFYHSWSMLSWDVKRAVTGGSSTLNTILRQSVEYQPNFHNQLFTAFCIAGSGGGLQHNTVGSKNLNLDNKNNTLTPAVTTTATTTTSSKNNKKNNHLGKHDNRPRYHYTNAHRCAVQTIISHIHAILYYLYTPGLSTIAHLNTITDHDLSQFYFNPRADFYTTNPSAIQRIQSKIQQRFALRYVGNKPLSQPESVTTRPIGLSDAMRYGGVLGSQGSVVITQPFTSTDAERLTSLLGNAANSNNSSSSNSKDDIHKNINNNHTHSDSSSLSTTQSHPQTLTLASIIHPHRPPQSSSSPSSISTPHGLSNRVLRSHTANQQFQSDPLSSSTIVPTTTATATKMEQKPNIDSISITTTIPVTATTRPPSSSSTNNKITTLCRRLAPKQQPPTRSRLTNLIAPSPPPSNEATLVNFSKYHIDITNHDVLVNHIGAISSKTKVLLRRRRRQRQRHRHRLQQLQLQQETRPNLQPQASPLPPLPRSLLLPIENKFNHIQDKIARRHPNCSSRNVATVAAGQLLVTTRTKTQLANTTNYLAHGHSTTTTTAPPPLDHPDLDNLTNLHNNFLTSTIKTKTSKAKVAAAQNLCSENIESILSIGHLQSLLLANKPFVPHDLWNQDCDGVSMAKVAQSQVTHEALTGYWTEMADTWVGRSQSRPHHPRASIIRIVNRMLVLKTRNLKKTNKRAKTVK